MLSKGPLQPQNSGNLILQKQISKWLSYKRGNELTPPASEGRASVSGLGTLDGHSFNSVRKKTLIRVRSNREGKLLGGGEFLVA